MNRIVAFVFLIIIISSCRSTKHISDSSEPLYEILYQSAQGGNDIEFYEIITNEKEFKIFLNNDLLKNKVEPKDILTSNFVLLNMGEKNTGGFSIGVESVQELEDSILIKVKKNVPKEGEMVTMAFTYPMCIVKINSKKDIIIQ